MQFYGFTEITATYNQLYASNYRAERYARLEKTAFDTAKTNLITAINSAISDGLTTTAEKANVDSKFALFYTVFQTFRAYVQKRSLG